MENSPKRKIVKIEANPLMAIGSKEKQYKRVAAYCRVSTDEEEQLNSFNAQVTYYTEAIAKNPSWHFVGVYADEGISGTGTKNRKDFLRLMRDCQKGKIDLILTKSISRFARNTVDSLTWVRKLKAMGVGVYFEEQAIDSLKTESEMLIGLFSVIAQSESENIGANVRWGIRQSMKKGEFCKNFSCFGYRKGEDGIPEIVPEEAEVVKKVFKLYLDGETIEGIGKYLKDNGVKTLRGKDTWSNSVIETMLTNEKYVGDILMQKTYIADTISKKVKKNRGELPKYLVQNNHPAIIDRDTFELVQVEISRRISKRKKSQRCITEQGKYSGKYVLTDILFCGCCGSHYRRTGKTKNGKRVYYWRCLGRIEGRCKDAPALEEQKLKATICRCLSKLFKDKNEALEVCNANIQYALSRDDAVLDAYALDEQIKDDYEKIDLLMERSENTEGDSERYEKEIIKLYEEISVLREKLNLAKKQAEENQSSKVEAKFILDSINNVTSKSFEDFDEVVIRRLVECIEVSHDKQITVVLKGGEKETQLFY